MTYIEPFIKSAINTVEMICSQKLEQGRPVMHKQSEITDSIGITINLTGELSGYVIIRFSFETAKAMVSAMMGSQIDTINDMAVSALSELGNMIMGNASTALSEKGIITDISTPMVIQGTVQIRTSEIMPVSVSLYNETLRMDLDIAVREKPAEKL